MSSPPKTKMTVKSLFIRPFFFDQPLYQYYMRYLSLIDKLIKSRLIYQQTENKKVGCDI